MSKNRPKHNSHLPQCIFCDKTVTKETKESMAVIFNAAKKPVWACLSHPGVKEEEERFDREFEKATAELRKQSRIGPI